MSAFMGGKMKIKGNMGLAQKFGALATAAMKAPAAKKPKGGADAPKPSSAAGGGPAGFGSTAVFERISANLRSQPSLAKKVGGVFLFKVSGARQDTAVMPPRS